MNKDIKKSLKFFYELKTSPKYQGYREAIKIIHKRKEDETKRLIKESNLIKKIKEKFICSCYKKLHIPYEGEDAKIADLRIMNKIKYW